MTFKVKKLSDKGIIPTRSDSGAAGFDLYAAEFACFYPKDRKLIKTNIAIHCAPGFYGQICGRSGLAYKNGVAVLGGIIDENYSGDIGVILLYTDNSDRPFIVNEGDRIAQIIFHRYYAPDFELVDDLEETERGEGGFGSTGK